jgi:hypothetical protein
MVILLGQAEIVIASKSGDFAVSGQSLTSR